MPSHDSTSPSCGIQKKAFDHHGLHYTQRAKYLRLSKDARSTADFEIMIERNIKIMLDNPADPQIVMPCER